MTGEFVTPNETHPTIQGGTVNSQAKGFQSIATTLGNIAGRSFQEAESYASEASKANLLQSHSMMQDVEAQSKIEIAKSPGHASLIAKNANDTIKGIISRAQLNKGDRNNLRYMGQSTSRSLSLNAAEKEIALSKQTAQEALLNAADDTLSSLRQLVGTDPDAAEKLINDQYDAIHGAVASGILTGVQANAIHKRFAAELQMSQEIMQGVREGILTASDLNAYHATDTNQVPLSNAGLPINSATSMNAAHHFGALTLNDMEAKIANGERLTTKDVASIKKISDLDKVLNYGVGAARATGDINSATSWIELTHKLDVLKSKEKLSTQEEGYKNKLNNFISNAKEPGWYQNFVAGTPEGARMYQDHAQNQTVIDQNTPFGTPEQSALQKHMQSVDNLNDLISKSDSLGIGMHIPDFLRQPIPMSLLGPITSAFNKGGDIQSAIINIQTLNPKNRVYAMNAFNGGTQDDYRKQLTVYEVGSIGQKADAGFLVDLFASQQADALGRTESAKNKQNKFLQLDQSKGGKSDNKLRAEITPALTQLNTFLRYQSNGPDLVSAKIDQAMRYVKKQAADHGDYEFKNTSNYMQTFVNNMNKAYGVKTSYNYVLDSNAIPLEEGQLSVLTSHALNETRTKLLEYMSPAKVDEFWANNPPMLVSSPGGRIEVIDVGGHYIPDKYGHPAYSQIYSEDIWRMAEADKSAYPQSQLEGAKYGEPWANLETMKLSYLRANPTVVRPLVEGNINLENRPKVYNKKGDYETVKTMTIEEDGKTVLIPQIVNGKELSKKEAIQHYKETREHLGVFKNEQEADKYDEQLHVRHGWLGASNKWGKK